MKSLIKFAAVFGLVLALCTLVGRASPPDHPSKNPISFTVSAADDAALSIVQLASLAELTVTPTQVNGIQKIVLTSYGFAPLKDERYQPPGNDKKPDNTLINGVISEHRSKLLMPLASYD